jgi:hypothetical protein
MKTLLAASLLSLSLAAPALAQSANGTVGQSGADAVGNASILPGTAGGGGSTGTGGSAGGSGTIGSGGSVIDNGSIDRGTTQSTVPDVTVPNAGSPGEGATGDNGGTDAIDPGTTQSTPSTSIPNATLPNLNQPGTSTGSGVAPRSSGGIPNSLNGNGAGVPGSTSTGPSGGGSSAY